MFRLSTIVFLAVVWFLTVAAPRAGGAGPDENILLLGVARPGRVDQRLSKELGDHLTRSGEIVNQKATLSTQDRACTDQECLDRLATREHVQVVLTAQLQESAPDSYYVTMTLFDAVRHSPLGERGLCDQCVGNALSIKLGETADKLLKRYRDRKYGVVSNAVVEPLGGPAEPGVTGQPSDGHTTTIPPEITNSGRSWPPPLSLNRKIIAGVLGGVAGAALITSIALAATDRQDTGLSCGQPLCALDNKPLYITGFVTTGLLLGGVALTIFWPENKKPAEVK